tara:strand:- start:1136 stop:1285 length:150 start_codon:yes stop_codon:yes gene_type:complete
MFVIFIVYLLKVNVIHDQLATLLLLQPDKAIAALPLHMLSNLKAKNTLL